MFKLHSSRPGFTRLRQGFTLIELLIVIGIIGTLASVTIVAINPQKQLGNADDARRIFAVRELQNAVSQYIIANSAPPTGVLTGVLNAKPICRLTIPAGSSGCVSLDSLVPTYIAALPLETAEADTNITGYRVFLLNGRPVVTAPYLGLLRRSCKELRNAYPTLPDGYYVVKAGGLTIPVYCDMTTDGGGWTIVSAFTGADNEQPLTSDTETLTNNPLTFAYYNISRAKKIALSAVSTETLFKRSTGEWLKASAPAFDANLNTPNTHVDAIVTVTASDGTSVAAYMGYSNFNNSMGGDFGITQAGFDHHSANYYHLRAGCTNMYFYSYSSGVADGDAGYDVNTALGNWSVSNGCDGAEGGALVFFVAMR